MNDSKASLLGRNPERKQLVYFKTEGMITLLVFLLLALMKSQPAWSQIVQWSVAEGGNDHFYEVVPASGGITWGNAGLAATDRGGYLATITSADENTFVFNLAEEDSTVWYSRYGPWLGGIQAVGAAEPAGGWSWITGESFTYQNWTPGQPNNNQNEDRIQFGGQAGRSSTWNDIGGNTVNFTRGFVVEYDQHPNAITLELVKDSDEVQLSWESRLNVPYTIEWTENFGGEWNTLTTVIGNGTIVTLNDFLQGKRRFYRSAAPQ